MFNDVGIVIPYYHINLTKLEQIAFLQCKKILGNYPIIILIPDYLEADHLTDKMITLERVPKEWMESVSAYNGMMMNIDFYNRFKRYRYILIYQLDAFVFCDKLQEMCDLGYDYIGAPWLHGLFYYLNAEKCIWHVGNGGFSLRKVDSFIRFLEGKQDIDISMQEDFFYAVMGSDEFKIAPLDIALQFAFESEVKECFKQNKERLPFGCHAWGKYDFSFWRPYIEEQGYPVNEIECYTQNKDEERRNHYFNLRKNFTFWKEAYSRDFLKKQLNRLFIRPVAYYVVWGAGKYGKLVCKMLSDAGFSVKYIVDSDESLTGKKFDGLEIKSDIDDVERGGIIIAVKRRVMEVAKQLDDKKYIYRKNYILLGDVIPIEEPWLMVF